MTDDRQAGPPPRRAPQTFDEFAARSALRSLLFAAVLVLAPAAVRPEFARYYLLQGGLLLAATGVFYALRHRLSARHLARAVLVVGVSVVALAAWVSGGSFSPAYHAYAVALVGAVWLVAPPRVALMATAGMAVLGAVLALATAAAWTPAPWITHTPWTAWATTSTASALIAVVQWLEVHRLRDTNERLNGELDARAKTEQALTASQAALKHSLSLLQAALESTVDGLLVVDREGAVAGYNQRFLALWRIPDALAAERDDARLLAHVVDQLDVPEAFLAKVQDLYARPDAVSFDTLTFKDGRCYERYSQPQVVDGQVVGRVWSFRDVTARVDDERRRAELERQLQQAHTLEALGTLAGGIAHDFNNLLTIVLGSVEQARVDEAPAAREASLQAIEQAAARAAALVREIREFSRPRATDRTVVAVADEVRSALRLLQSTMPKHLVVDTGLEPGVTMFAAATQVQQVVTNLVLNAAQAIGDSPGRITVRLADVAAPSVPAHTPEPRADRYAHLTVHDTGPGIPADALPDLFRPFFTTRSAEGGSGLGLAVVQGIVRRHHGAVAVDSAPGRGTTFHVFWPALPPMPAAPAPQPPASSATPPHGRGQHILVVDDETAIVGVVTTALTRLGYRATGLTDPREAWARFAADPQAFDAVLSDLSMPYLSGLALGRRVLDLRPGLPVVLFTGHAAELSPDEVRAAGFSAVLHKPMTAVALAEALHRVLPADR
ncbi:MAG: ATP-binding protein [Vicinamibacterales bacterium]